MNDQDGDDTVPLALPIERKSKIQAPLDLNIDQKWREEMEEFDELGLEFVLKVEFSKALEEKQIWNAYQGILCHSYPLAPSCDDSTSFPASIVVYGMKDNGGGMRGKKGREEEDEVIPLFSDRFFEGLEGSLNNKKKKPNTFSMLLFTTRLVNPAVRSMEDLLGEDEGSEEEGEEMEHGEEGEEEGEDGEEGDEEEINNSDEGIEPEMLTFQDLDLFVNQVTSSSLRLDPKCRVSSEESAKEAADRVERIAEMIDICDHPTTLEVVWKPKDESSSSQPGFKAFDIYSTFIELGFLYDNEHKQFILDVAYLLEKMRRRENGGKQSKRKMSEDDDMDEDAGFAIIEVVAGGQEKFSLEDFSNPEKRYQVVSFEMFLPQCSFPYATIKMMIWSAIQFQKKLGGYIADYAREEIPFQSLISDDVKINPLGSEVNEFIQMVKSCNIVPGDESLIQLFN